MEGVCVVCGQAHGPAEPHLYEYSQDVDEDLMCQICLQPFVCPVDLHCGHTFCQPCLHKHLLVQKLCPIDRKPTTVKDITSSSLVLKKLIDKLLVKCPPIADCGQTVQRGDLEDHLKFRCPALKSPLRVPQIIAPVQPLSQNTSPVKIGVLSAAAVAAGQFGRVSAVLCLGAVNGGVSPSPPQIATPSPILHPRR